MSLEADLEQAVKAIVQTAKDLRSEDSQLRIEITQTIREVSIERGITRDLVADVHKRIDTIDAKLDSIAAAITALGGRRG